MTDTLLFALIISAYWYVMGLAAVQLAYIRAVRAEGVPTRLEAIEDASHYQGVLFVPGAIAVGFAGAIAATRLLQNQLFEIGPRDPLTLVATAAVLLIVAAGAAAIPAWRATTIDPATALRD